jgi:hypothetical protein
VLRYLVTPVHHHLHHARSVRSNYAFLINYDLLFGTLNPDYHGAFEATVGRREPAPELVGPTGHLAAPAPAGGGDGAPIDAAPIDAAAAPARRAATRS